MTRNAGGSWEMLQKDRIETGFLDSETILCRRDSIIHEHWLMFIQYFRSSPPTDVLDSKVVLAVVHVVYLCVVQR